MEPQPAIDHGSVHSAEVGGVDQVAARVQLGQAGNGAVLPALDLFPGDEHEIRGAVIRAEIHVLGNAASEFREDHHDHVIRASDPFQIRQERRNGIGSIGEQPLVRIVLVDVRVERIVAIGRVIEARGHARRNQRRDLGQVETGDAVVHWRTVFRPSLADQY